MITPMEHNLKLISNRIPSMRYDGKEDFYVWQKRAKEKLSELLGMHSFEKCDPCFTVEYDKICDTYREIRFTLQSEEGYTFPSVLRIPLSAKGKVPVFICLQGHSKGFHISLGQPKYPGDEATISGGDRDFAVRIIKEGYAALAIEQRNFGEYGGNENGPGCYISSMTAILNGRTTIGERVWDVMCAIDALDNFNEIDQDNVYCMGNSGGGTATFYAAAMEERIKMAMPSCAVCTYKDSIAAMNHCSCNFVPNIALYFDMGDISGIIAPRPFIIVNGKEDPIFPEKGVIETYEITKKLYEAAGAKDNCALVTGMGGHRFYADDAFPVFKKMEKNHKNS